MVLVIYNQPLNSLQKFVILFLDKPLSRTNKGFPNYFIVTLSLLNCRGFARCLRSFPKKYIISKSMTTTATPIDPVSFDKTQFNKSVPLVALKVSAKKCTEYLNKFKDFILQRSKTKRIYTIEGDNEHRLLLLKDSITSFNELPDQLKDFHVANGGVYEPYDLQITYENLGVDEVLHQLLPSSIAEIPAAFEQAGHIAHLNLREESLPYKYLIGQVLLDKNPALKTVVNKTGTIETEFRTFPMELLAGENNFNVLLKESGATFNFNFGEVYWNSRLQMEHSRLINWISGLGEPSDSSSNSSFQMKKTVANLAKNANKQKQRDGSKNATTTSTDTAVSGRKEQARDIVVADMMAGVGPFAVPLAMGGLSPHNIKVYANDLNPASYKYLLLNARTNHCGNRLVSHNMDGRDFILSLLERNVVFHEAIMNLPQNATDFLDVFIGLATRLGPEKYTAWKSALPRIHVYAFSTAVEDPVGDIVNRSAGILQCDPTLLRHKGSNASASAAVSSEQEEVSNAADCVGHIVRDVSPKKVMVCLSFILPREVAFATPTVTHSGRDYSQIVKVDDVNMNIGRDRKRLAEEAQKLMGEEGVQTKIKKVEE